jgi:hypothetical protein
MHRFSPLGRRLAAYGKKVRERQDLSESTQRKMLHDNAMGYYKLAAV